MDSRPGDQRPPFTEVSVLLYVGLIEVSIFKAQAQIKFTKSGHPNNIYQYNLG